MLEHTPEGPHGPQRLSKAAAVIAEEFAIFARWASVPVPTPARARRMTNHGMRPPIQERITLLIPRIYILEIKVAPIGLDVESCDRHRSTVTSIVMVPASAFSIASLSALAASSIVGFSIPSSAAAA